METMTFEELFKLIKEQNNTINQLANNVSQLTNKVEMLEREVTKNASPWVRGWKGASDYTNISVTSLQRDIPELSESLTRFKLTDKTFLFKKAELDEFIEGTAVQG